MRDALEISGSVAVTRLTPPRAHAAVIVRQRLVDRVLTPEAALVVVSGPAGSGKSTLLAHAWAADPHGVWISASPRDVDAAVLATKQGGVDGGEVTGDIGLGAQELGPGHRRAGWCGVDAVMLEDPPRR